MKISRRLIVALLFAALLIFLGLLFWPFTVNNIIRPTALVLWFLLRILVLSIHQQYFWYAAILVAVFVLFRNLPRARSDEQANTYPDANTTMIKVGYLRGLFPYSGQNIYSDGTLKRQLIQLVTSLYALKQGVPNDFRVFDALQQGQIPMPENIRAFLFPQMPPVAGGPIGRFFRSIRTSLIRWIRQWTGREKTEHYKMIEEVLNFMETSLEIKK